MKRYFIVTIRSNTRIVTREVTTEGGAFMSENQLKLRFIEAGDIDKNDFIVILFIKELSESDYKDWIEEVEE